MTQRLEWYAIVIGSVLGLQAIGAAESGSPTQVHPPGEAAAIRPTEIVIFDFEESLGDWAIPDWAKTSNEYVGEELRLTQDYVAEGRQALELRVGFTGEGWTGAYVEREVDARDWTAFSRLSVDVYLPEGAPEGLTGKLILTVGAEWDWTEMNRTIPLQPGAWTTISVNLLPRSMDWTFFPDETFRADVRKMGVRVESNHGPAYRGSVYVDNVRLAEAP